MFSMSLLFLLAHAEEPPAHTAAGDLSEGAVVDTAWASSASVTCFSAVAARHFAGAVVFHTFEQKPSRDLVVRVTPAGALDVSVFVLQLSSMQRGARPPNVPAAWRCRTAYSAGAGKPEELTVEGYKNAYEVVVGVAAPAGVTAGTYQLEVWDRQGRAW